MTTTPAEQTATSGKSGERTGNAKSEALLKDRQFYASHEIPTIQLIPNGKQPRNAGWQRAATTDELGIEAEWSDAPNANFGMPTEGMLVLDVDGESNPWLDEVPGRRESLFKGPVVRTAGGGYHFYFQQPIGRAYRNTTGKVGPKIDTRANGGFVVGVGSIVNGRRYSFIPGHELDSSPREWPFPPQWLQELLDGRSPPVVPAAVSPEVIHEGGRNDYLARSGGYLRRGGFSESEILAALQARNVERCKPPLSDDEVRVIAKSVARYEADQISELIIDGIEPSAAPAKAIDPGPFPPSLLNVPGIVGRIVRFNLDGAFIRQPELALAGVLPFMATLYGQKIQDEHCTRTNLYSLGLGESGEGKDHALRVNKTLAIAIGMSEQIHGEPASSGGMLSAVKDTPVCLMQIDEIGRFLRSAQNVKAQPWMAEVISVWLSMFSSATGEFIGKSYSKEKGARISQPCVSVYGVSVPQSVWQSLTVENMTDGFLSRLLIFEAAANNPEVNRYPSMSPPGEEIISELNYWRDYVPGASYGGAPPQPRTLQYGPGVADLFWDAQLRYRQFAKAGLPGATLWTRAVEKAKKLSLIHQCSKDRQSDVIDMDSAKWGLDVVEHLTRRMLFQAGNWIADGQVGSVKASILRFMLSKNKKATTSELLASHRGLNARGLEELMDTLLVEGVVRQREEATAGRPRRIYEMVS